MNFEVFIKFDIWIFVIIVLLKFIMYGLEIVKLFKGGGVIMVKIFLGNYIYKYILNLM